MIGFQRRHLLSGFLMVPFVLALFGAESAMKRVTLPDVEPNEFKPYAHGHAYILTKHRSDTGTTLYRLDSEEPGRVHVLTRLDSFDTRDQVTGADVSADGKRLAVLTYTGIWVFDAREKEKWFDGAIRWLPTEDEEAEAITIDGDRLIIAADEGDGDLYDVPISSLRVVRE